MKQLFLIILAILFVCTIAVSVKIIAEEEKAAVCSGADDIVLPASNGEVAFPHKKHADEYGVACTACHHTVKEGETPKSCTAEGCHSEASEPKAKDAFHQQCYKGCHKTKNTDEGKAAPTKCSGCHIKEKTE